MAAMGSWGARQAALENSFIRHEEAAALRKHLERMVADGRLSDAAGDVPSTSTRVPRMGVPAGAILLSPEDVEVRSRNNLPEMKVRFKYYKNEFPGLSPSPMQQYKLGTSVSFGRGRWANGEASIWDVQAGRALAQTPSKQETWAEALRAKKIAQAQYESPLVQGYRLLPQFTPGKAFFWGTVLAVWGTAVSTLLVSKNMGLTKDNIPDKMRNAGEPFKQVLKERLEPLKETWAATTPSRQSEAMKMHEVPDVFLKLKAIMK